MAFPPEQCSSPQLHPYHRQGWSDQDGHQDDQDGHQDSSSPSLFRDRAPCDLWLFPKVRGCRYETTEEMKEPATKVIDMFTQEDFAGAFQKLL